MTGCADASLNRGARAHARTQGGKNSASMRTDRARVLREEMRETLAIRLVFPVRARRLERSRRVPTAPPSLRRARSLCSVLGEINQMPPLSGSTVT